MDLTTPPATNRDVFVAAYEALSAAGNVLIALDRLRYDLRHGEEGLSFVHSPITGEVLASRDALRELLGIKVYRI